MTMKAYLINLVSELNNKIIDLLKRIPVLICLIYERGTYNK